MSLCSLVASSKECADLRQEDTSNYRPLRCPASRIVASGCDVHARVTGFGRQVLLFLGTVGVMRAQFGC